MRLLVLIGMSIFLAGCQTAYDVQDLGGGRYGVSSLACPACGGTAQSAKLAYEQATEFCAAKGQIVITESQNNAMANAVGAGRTDMIFACVDQVTEEDTSDCYSEAFAELSTTHDEFVLDKAVAMVVPPEEGFPFVVLASEDKATEAEIAALKDVGGVWESCSRDRWTNVSPQYRKTYIATSNEILASLAKLVASKTTYGEYAAEVNASLASLDQQLGGIEREARAKRAAEAKERMEAASRLNSQIQSSIDKATAPVGNPVYNCTTIGNTTTCQ